MNIVLLSVIIVCYLLIIGYLGFLGFSRTTSDKDYLIAGRSIHPFVMAMSYGATFISTSAIIGFGGIAGLFGMGLMWLTFSNILVGIFIAFVFFGKRTRKMGHNLDAHTFPEFLGKRFKSDFIQIFGGLIIFLAMPLYSAVVLIGGARFIENTLNVNYHIALLVFSVIIAAYVIAGGLKGVMYTDALQGSIMFIDMSFLVNITYVQLESITGAQQALTAMAHLIQDSFQEVGHRGWTAMPAFNSQWWWTLFSTLILGVGVGVLAQPQLIVRFMTVKSNREINRAVLIGAVFIFVMVGGAYIVGSLSNAFFYTHPATQGMLSIQAAEGNPDVVMPTYINAAMPSWFVYLFMVALLSAAMSTLSSQFHAMGTAIGRDCFQKVFKTRINSIFITRIGIIIAIMVSIILAYKLPPGIIARGTALFFGICAATFLPAYCAAVYWRRASRRAAVKSIIAGFFASLFCLLFLHKKEAAALGVCKFIFNKEILIESFPWPFVDPILIALPFSTVVLIVATYVSKPLPDKHVSNCFNGID